MSIFNTVSSSQRQRPEPTKRRSKLSLAIALACVASTQGAGPALAENNSTVVLTSARLVQPFSDADDSRLGGSSIFGGQERLPTVSDNKRLQLPPISAATTARAEIGNGSMPESLIGAPENSQTALPEQIAERDAAWAWSTYCFSAPNTFSNPLYFEDVMLERHGHERFPAIQPAVSGVRFFATVPMLPYLMAVRPPCECEYKMGHFRAGDCVHPYLQRPPYERKAVVVQGLATAGVAVGLP